VAPKLTVPALSSYSEVLSRPLFSPTRRPSEDAPAATPETPMTLVAIVIASRRGPHALVRYGTPPQTDRVGEGQTIENWTIDAIKFDRVILRKNGSVLELVPVDAPQAHPATPANQSTPPTPPRPTPPTPPMPPRLPMPLRPAG
jgi:type II secretory pathway component PulC